MPGILGETEFTDHVVEQLSPFGIAITVPQPLTVELHYGESEPVLSIPLRPVYEAYLSSPEQLKSLLDPYLTEISWTVQPPRYSSKDIFTHAMPVMKDLFLEPIAQDGETVSLAGKEIVMRLPKGSILFQELVDRPEERLIVQFMIEQGRELFELSRGDVLNCFPEPNQIAGIAIQNLAKRALKSGLTTRSHPVSNFQTEILLVGFRDENLSPYVASLVNIADVMTVLQKSLQSTDGILVIIPTAEQMLISTTLNDQAVCELGRLANHLKQESTRTGSIRPVSSLVWRFKDGNVVGLQTVKLEETDS